MENLEKVKIERLLEKYFDAQSTLEEEETIRRYFSGKKIDKELSVYKPLFNNFSIEREMAGIDIKTVKVHFNRRRFLFRLTSFSAVAAVAIIGYIIFSGRTDSLQLIIDGQNIYNKELAVTKTEQQIEKINALMDKYRETSTKQLVNMKKSGDALSSLRIFSKVVSQE